MKFCKNCGKEIDVLNTNFCPNCGATLSVTASKVVKSLRLYQFEKLIIAFLLLIIPFTFDSFSRVVENKLSSNYISLPVTTTHHYSFLEGIALKDKSFLVIAFSIMITLLVIYCICELCFVFLNKGMFLINKISNTYHIIFLILSGLNAFLFAFCSFMIFKVNNSLKPDAFFFLYAFITVGLFIMDLAQVLQKNLHKKKNQYNNKQ